MDNVVPPKESVYPIDKRSLYISERSKQDIKKVKEIYLLLDGLSVIDVKHIISSIQNHLDSCTAVDIKLYELNIEPLFKSI